jgi:serine/threonine protein kinase
MRTATTNHPSVELAPGVMVAGRFVLQRRIGEGGMGVVWAAEHAVTHRVVALKMLKPERAGDPLLRQRFVREARAASAVRHPNIIEVRDVIELDDQAPAIVMDLLEGESLGARLSREGALRLDALAPIMVQVLSAVGTAHAAGVVHRDLKPDNIFLVPDGASVSVRVLDFGIAKVLPMAGEAAVSHGLTSSGVILGTPHYMAPEQHFGEKDIDARADVWALGVVLYQCLSGRRPTEAENVGQILRLLTTGTLVPLRDAAPDVPSDVAELADRMLERDRARRLASLVDAHRIIARYAPGASTPPFGEPAAATSQPTATPPAPLVHPIAQRDREISPHARMLALSTTLPTTSERQPSVSRRRAGARIGGALAAVVAVGACAARVLSARARPALQAGPGASTPTTPRLQPPGAPTHSAPPSASTAPSPATSTPRFNPYEHM